MRGAFAYHFYEATFNIDILFCRCLIEKHITIQSAKLLPIYCANFAIAIKVRLVADDEERKSIDVRWVRFRQENLLPVENVIERTRIGHIIYKDAAVGASVEGRAERLESFLTGSVPYL